MSSESASTSASTSTATFAIAANTTTVDVQVSDQAPAAAAASSAPVVVSGKKKWQSESYSIQSKTIWPGRGQHILAQVSHPRLDSAKVRRMGATSGELQPRTDSQHPTQFDDDTVVVYQAYNAKIATYAVEHQKFAGCPAFNETRMTWIKTNFLWMMFRCGWASKSNQDRVLAIWLKRDAFELYCANARTKGSTRDFKGTVRLQWDPDHFPNGECHPYRRAVQLGLKGVPGFASGADIVKIEDVTAFVLEQGRIAEQKDLSELLVARERVFVPESKDALAALQVTLSQSPTTDENE